MGVVYTSRVLSLFHYTGVDHNITERITSAVIH